MTPDATLPDVPETDLVFRARGVRKVYGMGEVEVHALRSVDLDVRRGELLGERTGLRTQVLCRTSAGDEIISV